MTVTRVIGKPSSSDASSLGAVNTLGFASFETGPGTPGRERTFLLSSQGYYVEWIRNAWLRNTAAPAAFVPSDEAVITALQTWRRTKGSFEKRFQQTRVPVL